MKKIFRNLMAIAIAAVTLTACEDVPEPYYVFAEEDSSDNPAAVEAQGSGTQADPYNVAAAIAKCKEVGTTLSTEKYYVKGKVVVATTADATYGNASFYIADTDEGEKFYCYQVAGTDGKKLAAGYPINVDDEVVVYGAIYNYNGKTPETEGKGAAYIVTINGKRTDDNGSTDEPAAEPVGDGTEASPFNVAAAIAKCQEIGTEAPSDKFYVKGVVVTGGTADATYGNASFYIGDSENASSVFYCYQVYGSNAQKLPAGYAVNKGDEVVVYGPIYNYKGNTPETAGKGAAYIVTINGKSTGDNTPAPQPSGEVKTVTIAEFNAAAESTDVWYQLTGIVKNLKDNDIYGNFDLEDATGSVYVYGLLSEKGGAKKLFQDLVAAKGIKEGSTITIIGNRGSYNDKIEVTNAYFVSIEGGNTTPPEEPNPNPNINQGGTLEGNVLTVNAAEFGFAAEAEATTATLTDGTKVTFSKGTGSSDPKYYSGNYASVRVYANNTVTIESSKKIASVAITTTEPNGSTKYNGSDLAYANKESNKAEKPDDTSINFNGQGLQTVTLVNYSEKNSGNQLRISKMVITYAE